MHKKIYLSVTLAISLSLFSSCGVSQASPLQEEEEECTVISCTESELNAPLPGAEAEEEIFEPTTNNFSKYNAPSFDSSWGLKRSTYDKAVSYYQSSGLISNPRYMVVIDFSQHSSRKRMYLFDMNSGTVQRYFTAHGKGSDNDNDGFARQFSNTNNSKMSSLGFYLTLGTYKGKHGTSLRIRGLSSSNSNAEKRAVVFHGAKYVRPGMAKLGRSWGCPAVETSVISGLISKIKGGALVLMED